METCAVIADDYGKSLLSEIKTLEKFVSRSGPPSDVLKPMKMLHDLARFYIGGSVLDELLTDDFTNEQIWQQLKIATSSVEKTFENASLCFQKKRKRTNDATEESTEKKLCTSETNDKIEGDSDAESDDELKKITDRWNIDGRQLEDEDEDDDDDDEDDDEEEDDKAEKDEEDAEDDLKEDSDVSDGESPLDTLKKALKSKKKKTSVVDDKFFNLEDMHSFLDQQDRLANREVSEEADENDDDGNYMFRNISSDEDEDDEKNAKYSQFSDDLEEKNAVKGDKNDDDEKDDDEAMDRDEENGKDADEASESDSHEDDEDDENEDEDMEQDDIVGDNIDQHKENKLNKVGKTDNEPKSAFQKKQELMKRQITDVEESNLAEKPWHLRGEITAADRPENSLLTTHLDYKFNSAPTLDDDNKDVLSIEDLLRKYYDSDAFVVNVTRKVKPVGTTVKYRKDIVLDHEKSKLGLAEVLERDYLGQTQTRNQKEEDEYKENRKILNNLLLGLQMMFSNTPVTVMPPKLDLQIVENVPAIVVEEVAPVFVSDATRLTAEEVQGKRKGELIGATEKTKTNKKRERRLKKKFQHQKAQQKKVRAADPNSKEAHEEAQKQLERKSKRGKHITIHETDKKKKKLSSKDFFNQLQNQVTSHMDKKKEGLDKQKRKKNKKEQS